MRKNIFSFILLAVLSIFGSLALWTALPVSALTPTPTYDPLVEPPLPPNPTELELGRNLFWHWCMTCHGDQGQGLTDDFRTIWEPDHQNCWARGCHAGHNGDLGFPIPTVVPPIVGAGPMRKFATLADLYTFLKGTHPPQHPGILEEKEYHAIAAYVFALNNRPLEVATLPPTATPTLAATPTPSPTPAPQPIPVATASHPSPWLLILLPTLALIGVLIFLAARRKRKV